MAEKFQCPICTAESALLDTLDLNKSCMVSEGSRFAPAGVPIDYALCCECGFCFAPGPMAWSRSDFQEKIYNDGYVLVDPDYLESRPRSNAEMLITMFGGRPPDIRHLDYGGGNGMLVNCLKKANWRSVSYDPFVDREQSPAHLGKFDFITAFEVFEHVPDARELVLSLRSLLAPEGLILFSTLLSDGYILPGQKVSWWYAAPRNGHISLYSRKSLSVLAQQNKLEFHSYSVGLHSLFMTMPSWARAIKYAAPVPLGRIKKLVLALKQRVKEALR